METHTSASKEMLVEHAAWLTSPRHEVWGRTSRGLLSRPDDVITSAQGIASNLHHQSPFPPGNDVFPSPGRMANLNSKWRGL